MTLVDWNEWWLMFKMSVILNLSVSTEQPKCSDERKCKWQEIRLIITPTIVLTTGHFSNSTELLKFRGKRQIARLSSKFCGPQETVGPSHQNYYVNTMPINTGAGLTLNSTIVLTIFFSPTYNWLGQFPHFSLTAVKFLGITRFSRRIFFQIDIIILICS